jgi:hypothetical protein
MMLMARKKSVLRQHLSRLGKKGGPKGGKARMQALTAEERRELGRKGALARWGKPKAKGA